MLTRFLASVLMGAFVFGGIASAAVDYTFSDVDTSTDYYNAIYWAADEGIATGYGNGMWGPDECVRRAELMKMVIESSAYDEYDPMYTKAYFSDVNVGDWYFDYVMKARGQGLIEGYADGTFKPNRCVNRAEAMKIVVNTLIEKDPTGWPTGGLFYDNKLVVDVDTRDWYIPYAYRLFKDRLVGTNHTQYAGDVAGVYTIKFFPGDDMTRKEVAEMLNRINKYINSRVQ